MPKLNETVGNDGREPLPLGTNGRNGCGWDSLRTSQLSTIKITFGGLMLRRLRPIVLILAVTFVFAIRTHAQTIPDSLSDALFWRMSTDASEEDGSFRSDNLVSNELFFQYAIPDLVKTARSGRIYMGVGPEQNFTYIAALKPKMAFIVDIRRGNKDLHLLYKALFEMSKDRADFVGMLFSRKRPAGLNSTSSPKEIFDAYLNVEADEELCNTNLKAIVDLLTKKHSFELTPLDISGIEYVYRNFYTFGPSITYSSSGNGGFGRGGFTNYAALMAATDGDGVFRSYLANEENFNYLKELELKNLIIPVIGNFAGPKAIRAVGKYIREMDGVVSAFYLSNVEDYLGGDLWNRFCANVATLPIDETSTFIRSVRGGRYGSAGFGGRGLNTDLGNIPSEVKGCGGGRSK
jgi:hypothetical protein